MMPKYVPVTLGKKDTENLPLSDSYTEPSILYFLFHLIYAILPYMLGINITVLHIRNIRLQYLKYFT